MNVPVLWSKGLVGSSNQRIEVLLTRFQILPLLVRHGLVPVFIFEKGVMSYLSETKWKQFRVSHDPLNLIFAFFCFERRCFCSGLNILKNRVLHGRMYRQLGWP